MPKNQLNIKPRIKFMCIFNSNNLILSEYV